MRVHDVVNVYFHPAGVVAVVGAGGCTFPLFGFAHICGD